MLCIQGTRKIIKHNKAIKWLQWFLRHVKGYRTEFLAFERWLRKLSLIFSKHKRKIEVFQLSKYN